MQRRVYHILFNTIVLLAFFNTSCNEWYNHPLGNNLSVWDGDGDRNKIIVYCEGSCHGGIQVLPTYEGMTTTGEYVENAKSNKEWVIAKTKKKTDSIENYYIINKDFNFEKVDCSKANCDSILQSHVTGPLTLSEFKEKIEKLQINLDFK